MSAAPSRAPTGRAADAAAIADFVARRGVTKCPPAAVAPVAGGVAPQPALAEHAARRAEADKVARDPRQRAAEGRRLQAARARAEKQEGASFDGARDEAEKVAALPPARPVAALAPATAPGHDPGPRPEMAWLPLAALAVDHSYQRPLQAARARATGRAFRWATFQPLTVTPIAADAAGKRRFAVVDGQHRLAAARQVPGLAEVPCYIVPLAEVEAQAAAFVGINKGRAPVTNIDLYRAALRARQRWAVQLKRILDGHGVKVAERPGGGLGPMTTSAVRALRRALERYGEPVLARVLGVLAAAWPDRPQAFMERAIITLGRLMHERPGIPDAALVAVLRATTPHGFERKVWDLADRRGCDPAEALRQLVELKAGR